MDWYEISVLKKMAKKNHPTIDKLIGIPASYGQTKCDTLLRIFVNPTSETIEDVLSVQNEDFMSSENYMHILGALKLEGGDYEISKVDNILVGETKRKVLSIEGKTSHGLKATSFSKNVFVCLPLFILVFNLLITDIDEPVAETVKKDFSKILDSLKIVKA